jgi:hypothetical protein
MKNEGVAGCQIPGVCDNLIGVRNYRIHLDAPGLVPDNPSAVLACCLRVIAVAVISNGEIVLRH